MSGELPTDREAPYTVHEASRELLAALQRMTKREHLSFNVVSWEYELYSALEREAEPPAGETGA